VEEILYINNKITKFIFLVIDKNSSFEKQDYCRVSMKLFHLKEHSY